MAIPAGPSAVMAVTMTTPVGKCPSTCRYLAASMSGDSLFSVTAGSLGEGDRQSLVCGEHLADAETLALEHRSSEQGIELVVVV